LRIEQRTRTLPLRIEQRTRTLQLRIEQRTRTLPLRIEQDTPDFWIELRIPFLASHANPNIKNPQFLSPISCAFVN
ncbi:hypothetical protein VIGAN_UM023400, partial [Vigna angularis var. angularis]